MSTGSVDHINKGGLTKFGPVSLRIYHDTEKPRNGRMICVDEGGLYPNGDGDNSVGVTGVQIFQALAEAFDLSAYAPHVYCSQSECFVRVNETPGHFYSAALLCPDNKIPPRLDVKLLHRGPSPSSGKSVHADQLICDSASTELKGAWFGIGIVRGKVASNHGSLWRSALQLGSSYSFTIGRRYDKKVEGAADVFKSHRQVPCFSYASVAAFAASAPVDAQWVAVEYGGQPLAHFRHPKRAVYILGSEDSGIPPALVARAHHHVSIPTAPGRPSSLNVAAAGAIVMWDRLLKISASSKAATEFEENTNGFHSKRYSAPVATSPQEPIPEEVVEPSEA